MLDSQWTLLILDIIGGGALIALPGTENLVRRYALAYLVEAAFLLHRS